ncbi:hypothetical protein [Alkalicoccobacillus murimartini]|uniref:Trans-2-enoyl-CoA reductase n=1 Tax=Alkalicoccobacillus murimartini TaxID=171685 RepID=A0ABT9YM70_9BACI|nr:hypothetical protein [Alkalicoccobacillus murimartini]MDQ0208287.1 trans-2-enoyl-CoA reductase [Alkalicoccobacillus murimartini]
MKKKSCSSGVCKSLIIGGVAVIGIATVLSKKKWRDQLCEEAQNLKSATSETFVFIRDNREEIIDQVKETANEVSVIISDLSADFKKLSDTANHIRISSKEAIGSAREAALEVKYLKNHQDEE